jgi:hypothetical protein
MRFAAVVGADDDANPEPGEVSCMLMAVAQRTFDEVSDHVVEAVHEAARRLKLIAIAAIDVGQQLVASNFDLEKDVVVDRPDPLVRCVRVGELFRCLGQQRVLDSLKRCPG